MIFVTGATGFVGSYLCEFLIQKGYKIKASKRPNSIIPHQLVKYRYEIEWVDVDLLDYFSVYEALSNCKAVFHCAAMISFDPKMKKEMWKSNVDVTKNLVDACLEFPDIYLCMVSSIAAVGEAKAGNLIDENCRWVYHKTESDYSITKFEAEREVWRGINEGLSASIVNPSVILGYDERRKGSMFFIDQIQKGLKYYTDGVVGFVDVQDVVECMVMLYEKGIVNERFILNAENLSYKSFFEIIATALNKPIPNKRISKRTLTFVSIILSIVGMFTSKRNPLSKYTIQSAYKKLYFSNDKITKTLDFRFINVKESVLRMIKENQ
jgi:dihydroflavonol-4-reductase